MSQKGRKNKFRLGIQIFFFLLLALIVVNKELAEKGGQALPLLSAASLHGLCPFGGVVSLYQLTTVGTLVQKIHDSSLVLMALVFILAIFFGPVFCGWVCPLGSFQEWLGKIGKRIFKKKYNKLIPYHVDRYLYFLRYGVLACVIYVTAQT